MSKKTKHNGDVENGKKQPKHDKRSKEERVISLLFSAYSFIFVQLYFSGVIYMVFQMVYFERELEKRVLRANSLGKDRNYDRYWWFRWDGRIFVESSDSKIWGYYSSKEEVQNKALLMVISLFFDYIVAILTCNLRTA